MVLLSMHISFLIKGKIIEFRFLVLQRRGATIYAEFLGGSSTSDAYHLTETHPDGNESRLYYCNSFLFNPDVVFMQHFILELLFS